ncbi:hypothetical protein RMB12_05895 [Acinetobacter sp. V117_2]|uniref:hypothetical protein n=1 Tax=Acinetobacter sp. V117_2 TaxID=3072989 RepID=UPI00287E6226|nr:hypothetical protein [Acinetobacter sp. V117_2]MDS7966556.1 hypothetical protein [Acinetobacter sp. V117_2]
MKTDQIILVIVASFAFHFAVKFLMQWLVGEYNHGAVVEWMRRGFAFGLGFIFSMLVMIVIVHILRGLMNEY